MSSELLALSDDAGYLKPEAGVVAVRGRCPRDGGLLVAAQRNRQVGRRLRRCTEHTHAHMLIHYLQTWTTQSTKWTQRLSPIYRNSE